MSIRGTLERIDEKPVPTIFRVALENALFGALGVGLLYLVYKLSGNGKKS